jgi:hypothetical protein
LIFYLGWINHRIVLHNYFETSSHLVQNFKANITQGVCDGVREQAADQSSGAPGSTGEVASAEIVSGIVCGHQVVLFGKKPMGFRGQGAVKAVLSLIVCLFFIINIQLLLYSIILCPSS